MRCFCLLPVMVEFNNFHECLVLQTWLRLIPELRQLITNNVYCSIMNNTFINSERVDLFLWLLTCKISSVDLFQGMESNSTKTVFSLWFQWEKTAKQAYSNTGGTKKRQFRSAFVDTPAFYCVLTHWSHGRLSPLFFLMLGKIIVEVQNVFIMFCFCLNCFSHHVIALVILYLKLLFAAGWVETVKSGACTTELRVDIIFIPILVLLIFQVLVCMDIFIKVLVLILNR